ncbi:MAG TPA: hypothetical protein VJ826_09495, partial [Candidatus Polarisedimenticolaceae bacterium]|nr:hypothetical protein [Candidatus Polarisedimenticolaceae bacterium]
MVIAAVLAVGLAGVHTMWQLRSRARIGAGVVALLAMLAGVVAIADDDPALRTRPPVRRGPVEAPMVEDSSDKVSAPAFTDISSYVQANETRVGLAAGPFDPIDWGGFVAAGSGGAACVLNRQGNALQSIRSADGGVTFAGETL